jgi:RHS repeat-associated protein
MPAPRIVTSTVLRGFVALELLFPLLVGSLSVPVTPVTPVKSVAVAPMAIAFVQTIGTATKTGKPNKSIRVIVGGGGVEAGHSIIVALRTGRVKKAAKCSDTRGNAYHEDIAIRGTGKSRAAILSAHAVIALRPGDVIRCRYKSFPHRTAISVNEFSGLAKAPLDRVAARAGSSKFPNSGLTRATRHADELVFGYVQSSAWKPATSGSIPHETYANPPNSAPYKRIGTVAKPGNVRPAYRIVRTRGQFQANGSRKRKGNWLALIATYRAAPPPTQGTFTVTKVLHNDNGGTAACADFAFQVDGGSDTTFEPDCSNAVTVDAGSHTVTETEHPGYTTSYDGCAAVPIPAGGGGACAITNDDDAPSLTLVKHVINDDGGTNEPADWTLTASGPSGFSGTTPASSPTSFDAGTYQLSESLIAGYTSSAWNCVGGSQSDADTVVIALGEDATCTVTNDDVPADTIVAPPLDPSVATDLKDATEFLYTGPNPVQTGVDPATIKQTRAAVLRGRVLTSDGEPLPDVTVAALDHPEFGTTLSRADGMFDLAVNGGGPLTLTYTRANRLPAQRTVQVPWRDYVVVPDVVLLTLDPAVTSVDLDTATDVQVVQGSTVADSDGTRQATLLISPGTGAQMVKPDGTSETLTTMHVRATEYTVGALGPEAMPAPLPPASGYTYAIEFSVDEALAAGASDVRFDKPVYQYVENFLNLRIGENVPSGFYDRQKATWVPSENGRVVKIIDITGALADLDTDGDGAADNDPALGITDAERARLAELYTAGQGLWRVPIQHFSSWDSNHGTRCKDDDCDPPNVEPPVATAGDEDPYPTCQAGSVIECENQVLGENINIAGTPFSLNYRSNRVPGYRAPYAIDIPLSGASINPKAIRIELAVSIAGREFTQTFAPAANLKTTFIWDGLDAYGRAPTGAQQATVKVGWVYEMEYVQTRRFGYNGNGIPISSDPAREEITLWRPFAIPLQNLQAPRANLGGWTLSEQHAYDPVARKLYLGNGQRQTASALGPVIDTVPGTANPGSAHIAVGPDGSLYMAEQGQQPHVVTRLSPDGTRVVIAGSGPACNNTDPCGDGAPATQARLTTIRGLAFGPDGSLYISDSGMFKVRRVAPDGIISTVAGTGVPGDTGDGGPATQATIQFVGTVTVDPDGNIYLGQEGNGARIRRIDPEGVISTFAGGGTSTAPVVQATDARVTPNGMTIGPDGLLYVVATAGGAYQVRRVNPDGVIETIAGLGPVGTVGDGGPALQARFGLLEGIAFGPDSSLYVSDTQTHRVRRIGTDGIITTVAGNGQTCTSGQPCGDGGPATQAAINPWGLAVNPEGDLYVNTASNARVRAIRSALPGNLGSLETFVASQDGGEIYAFEGRHVRTLDAQTGTTRYAFHYNSVGNLLSVTDGDGNVTTVERGADGLPTAVVGPDGQRTELTLDPSGFLASVTTPADETTQLENTSDGLLTGMTTPRGHTYSYTYDMWGQLTRDDDPAGGFKTLTETTRPTGYTVDEATALGRTTRYAVERLPDGSTRKTTTDPAGLQEQQVRGTDDTRVTTYPDGSAQSITLGPDPRFRMQAPTAQDATFTTPGGLTYHLAETRTTTPANPQDPLDVTSLTEQTTINGRVYASTFDTAASHITETSPEGRQVVTTVDAQGRPLEVQAPGLQPITYTYDTRGRLKGVNQGAREILLTYNAAGFPDTLIDPLHRATTFVYDVDGRVVTQNMPGGRTIGLSYDADGNLTRLTPPGRPAHTFGYTPVDLTSRYDPPDVGAGTNASQYSYNLDRQPTQLDRPDAESVVVSYDPAGRPDGLTIPGRAVDIGFDATTGNLAAITVTGGEALDYSYDGPLMKTETWSGPVAGSVSRTYDNDLNIVSRSVNGGSAITFEYDDDDLTTQAGALALGYDPQNGLLTDTTLGDVSSAYGHNGHGELVSHTTRTSTGTLQDVTLVRDDLGRLTSKTETIGGVETTYGYTYDAAGRLETENVDGTAVATYAYDLNGNRLNVTRPGGTVSATYDDQDRLLTYGSTTFTYTANGELSSRTTGGETTTYDYDALGNMVSVDLADGTNVSYEVDGSNRRVDRKVDGLLTQAWLWQDDLKPIAELDGSGNVVTRFVYATKDNVPDYMVKGGTTYRIVTDQLGSVRLVVDAMTGQVAQRMDYDLYGRVLADTSPGFQPFGFAGGMYDAATGLVRFGARDYDPQTGRWTTKDPLGFGGGNTNVYAYASDDPVNLIDPDGSDEYAAGFVGPLPPGGTRTYVADLTDPRLVPLLSGGVAPIFYFPPGTPDNLKQQCVSLTKTFAGVPCTRCWRAGAPAAGGTLKPGTAVATFEHGRYPTEHKNSGIFLSMAGGGRIVIIDQWPKHEHKGRARILRPWPDREDDSGSYYAITAPEGECGCRTVR